jgi:hypothetical protein
MVSSASSPRIRLGNLISGNSGLTSGGGPAISPDIPKLTHAMPISRAPSARYSLRGRIRCFEFLIVTGDKSVFLMTKAGVQRAMTIGVTSLLNSVCCLGPGPLTLNFAPDYNTHVRILPVKSHQANRAEHQALTKNSADRARPGRSTLNGWKASDKSRDSLDGESAAPGTGAFRRLNSASGKTAALAAIPCCWCAGWMLPRHPHKAR